MRFFSSCIILTTVLGANEPAPAWFGNAPPGVSNEGCKDIHQDCKALGALLFDLGGQCRYPAAELCMKTCGQCWRVAAAKSCALAARSCHPFCNETVDWVKFMSEAVERAKSEMPKARIVSTKPVMAEFPGFLTAREADALIATAEKSGFQREDELPQHIRDVEKTDCEDSVCTLDPFVQEVYRRVSHVLGIPPQNFESMEFLRYKKNQHYKPHMDDELWEEMPALSAGLRVLTVFFYFTEVMSGGETAFPNANLTVKPEKGKVVIWSNTRADIFKPSRFALHQSVPVRSGTKVASNFWVHPFDYRAQEKYCVPLYERGLFG